MQKLPNHPFCEDTLNVVITDVRESPSVKILQLISASTLILAKQRSGHSYRSPTWPCGACDLRYNNLNCIVNAILVPQEMRVETGHARLLRHLLRRRHRLNHYPLHV